MSEKLLTAGVDVEAFDLENTMERVLQTIVDVYASYNMPLPERQYWGIGRPAEDCAQVVVSFLRMYLGAPGQESTTPQNCNQPRSAVLNISVSRNIPSGVKGNAAPIRLAMEASANTAADVTILMSSVRQFDNWNEFGHGPGVIASVDAQDAGGLIQTVNMSLILAVG